MSKNYHREVIDVLAWRELDPMAMLRQIAKDRPATLYRAAVQLGYHRPVTLEDRVRDMMKQEGMKIEAIKLVRNEKGIGLKEAKDYVEALAS